MAKDTLDTQTMDLLTGQTQEEKRSANPAGEGTMKELRFINKPALKEFKALPKPIQKRFALDLQAISQGKAPFSKFKHIADSVGAGAIELIENGRPAYRTVYVAKFEGAVYVLHSFTKTTNGVDRKAMATAKKRYKAMLAERKL